MFSAFCTDNFVAAYDTETLLTRMLLESMIEFVSSQVQAGAVEAAMIKLTDFHQLSQWALNSFSSRFQTDFHSVLCKSFSL